MKLRLLCHLSLLFCLSASVLYAGNSRTGTTAFQFLKIGIGAKALSMGGAFVGLADDESAAYYNPAGLIGLTNNAVAASYMNYVADIQSGNLIFVQPRGYSPDIGSDYFDDDDPWQKEARSALGFSVTYLNYGTIDEADASGKIIGDFGGSDMAFALTYAFKPVSELALGGSAKFIYQKIDEFSASGVAVDLGLLYRFRDGRTSAGLSASNLGFQLSGLSEEHKDPLPILLRGGMSHRLRGAPITVSGEGVLPSDNSVYGSLGAEYSPHQLIALRAGYSSFGREFKTEGGGNAGAGFAFGAGFRFPEFTVDYAYLPYADLGSLHRVNFAYKW